METLNSQSTCRVIPLAPQPQAPAASAPPSPLTECRIGRRRSTELIFKSLITAAEKRSELPIFDLETGMAQTATAHYTALQQVTRALRMAGRLLPKIVAGDKKRYTLRVIGVRGSYHKGTARIGLFPPDLSYDGAQSIEQQKLYERCGLIGAPDRVVPSDVDLSVEIIRFAPPQTAVKRCLSMVGRAVSKLLYALQLDQDPIELARERERLGSWAPEQRAVMAEAEKVLSKIFDRTKVYISADFRGFPCEVGVDAVLKKIGSIPFQIDAPPPRHKLCYER